MCLAVPGKLLDVQGDDPLLRSGRVSFGGVIKPVSLACTPEARAGDYVLVHVGVAISVVDPAEAEQTLGYLREMGELAELEDEPASPSSAPSP
ncbi:MAG TPA: HypC/HybG/HupF family hydrogenase formation chaperone [Opitutaceae bacterium]|nr:HypC/HybG/HupF family hydrogenase formation chaperone [Opitutaceae bacterium]